MAQSCRFDRMPRMRFSVSSMNEFKFILGKRHSLPTLLNASDGTAKIII